MWVQSNADHNWEKTESDYSNPIGLLSDCYRRIERFLNVKILVTNRARGAELTSVGLAMQGGAQLI